MNLNVCFTGLYTTDSPLLTQRVGTDSRRSLLLHNTYRLIGLSFENIARLIGHIVGGNSNHIWTLSRLFHR